MKYDIKEFHLLAEPVVREMSPGVKTHLWGYNGQSPRPMIDVIEGDRVRVFVTNKLPEHTSVHRHGQRLPNGMADMAAMEMPTPDNTAPLMTGAGPFAAAAIPCARGRSTSTASGSACTCAPTAPTSAPT